MSVMPKMGSKGVSRVRAFFTQTLIVILINIPMVSFGLVLGWVSLASGESGAGAGEGDAQVLAAAATTFVASLAGVPLSARAVAAGRKPAILASSAAFALCWLLKLVGGGWWVVCARAFAGLGGAAAWCVAPLLAREMCDERVRGAAVAAQVLGHNLGLLLMYLAAMAPVSHSTVLWGCLALSLGHCLAYACVPESPHHLAAHGKLEEAKASLAWAHGLSADSEELAVRVAELPSPEEQEPSPLALTKDMLSAPGRRRAFILCCVAVVGQEVCGVLALLQFAERVFVLTRDEELDADGAGAPAGVLGSPARHAVMLGVVQLVASAISLYLVEKVGRKRLMVTCGLVTAACLGLGTVAHSLAGVAVAGAVFADSAGLQPAPYAMLADMFDYQYLGCAVTLISALEWAGNALEVVVFPLVAGAGGVRAALALGAALTLALSALVAAALPETRGKTPQQIYDEICPAVRAPPHKRGDGSVPSDVTVCTNM